ncbi:MAG: M48 family metallopeptidase [Gammaproteobacteria bacterium]|nr:M48 family metallopeptidase [Gammaproteobacteria bacterium]
MNRSLTIKPMIHRRQTLQYGEKKIPYQLFFVVSEGAKIIIDVLPNGTVHVKAPEGRSLPEIKQAVFKRARWINNHIERIQQQQAHVLPRQYVSGESHYYLGRRYLLKVFDATECAPQVKLLRGQLQVYTNSRDPKAIKALLYGWYRQHAQETFARRLLALLPQVLWLKQTPEWKLRLMKKQWGSCSPEGVLSLNPQLVKAPRECIDYVVLHELCHLQEHNHSKKFYRLLSRMMPEWEHVKARLDGMSELLLVD